MRPRGTRREELPIVDEAFGVSRAPIGQPDPPRPSWGRDENARLRLFCKCGTCLLVLERGPYAVAIGIDGRPRGGALRCPRCGRTFDALLGYLPPPGVSGRAEALAIIENERRSLAREVDDRNRTGQHRPFDSLA